MVPQHCCPAELEVTFPGHVRGPQWCKGLPQTVKVLGRHRLSGIACVMSTHTGKVPQH